MSDLKGEGVTRRGFIKALGTTAAALPLVAGVTENSGVDAQAQSMPAGKGQATRAVTLDVNEAVYKLQLEPRRTLADVIRKELGLTGTKVSCDHASCGACTVLMEGRAVFACHMLAAQAEGRPFTTIEHLAEGEKLHPIQEAFIEHDALQCGFCTPGMIMAIKGVLDRKGAATREEIRQAISGNLCRCGAYNHILDAAVAAQRKMKTLTKG
jgi:aerobic-type carbon monoxide dehydrogenase small subunit (CoxS/CutS family)